MYKKTHTITKSKYQNIGTAKHCVISYCSVFADTGYFQYSDDIPSVIIKATAAAITKNMILLFYVVSTSMNTNMNLSIYDFIILFYAPNCTAII